MLQMRPTIFARILIGYLAIFIPAAAVSAYAFSQLILFRRVTNGIVQVDNHLRDLVPKIADSFLAQIRYERKYIITKDKEFINQFIIAEADVDKRIKEAISVADDMHEKEMLIGIKNDYEHYKFTFKKEVKFIGKKRSYLQINFKKEKEKTIDEILWKLKNLKLYIEQNTYNKIKHLEESVIKANKIAIIMAAGFILLGIITSICITRSITGPLSYMRNNIKKVARGDFEGSLDTSFPPEIEEMARDFNLMCGKLKATDKMKSDFFSLMAHELRTPLASIREGSNLLLLHIEDNYKNKLKEILTIIVEESNRLTNLVNSLLDLSKMEAGMITLKFEKFEISSLINKAVSGVGPLSMTKNVSINVEISLDLPYVELDGERILQVLRNLIGNAIKFTPHGGSITISARSIDKGLRVSVADTGPGIAREDLNAIFDKFQQAAMTNYSKIRGTGLGLAIVKHIINAHGGKVWVESEIGRGSIFIFVLPA